MYTLLGPVTQRSEITGVRTHRPLVWLTSFGPSFRFLVGSRRNSSSSGGVSRDPQEDKLEVYRVYGYTGPFRPNWVVGNPRFDLRTGHVRVSWDFYVQGDPLHLIRLEEGVKDTDTLLPPSLMSSLLLFVVRLFTNELFPRWTFTSRTRAHKGPGTTIHTHVRTHSEGPAYTHTYIHGSSVPDTR